MPANAPIIVGVAHVDQKITNLDGAREPLDLMHDAVKGALDDAGVSISSLKPDSLRVVRGIWPYADPARAIAERFNISKVQTALTPYGGNFVQSAINASANDLLQGQHQAIILTGAECGNTQAKAAKAGEELHWQEAHGTPDRLIGQDSEMRHDAEKAVRIGRPIQVYPLFETALRHHLQLGVEEHLEHISELWARFSKVAAGNPHAWIADAKTAQEIRTPSKVNRPVSFPYPKFMNSNNNVDQGAAVIMCTEAHAQSLGIPRDKWVYPWAGTDAHDHYFVSNRDTLYQSPAIRLAGNRVLEMTDTSVDQLDLVDVYSCFPSAVQIAARELGFDINRPLTITGGLTWAGGPLNNYVMHSVVRMVERLREAQEQRGLITANGGYLTKHAFGLYSSTPPTQPFQYADLQEQVDALPQRQVDQAFEGTGTVEAYSVMYNGSALEKAFIAVRTPADSRAWAVCDDPDTLAEMIMQEFCGQSVQVAAHQASF